MPKHTNKFVNKSHDLGLRRGERKKGKGGLLSRIIFLFTAVIVTILLCSFIHLLFAAIRQPALSRDDQWIRGQVVTSQPRGGHIDMEAGISEILEQTVGGIDKKRLIDLGAAVRDNDPCFSLIDQGWSGLLIDGDGNQPEKWNTRFPNNDKVKGVVSYILADTIVGLLENFGFNEDVDLLKIDIDSFDCYVMQAILDAGIRPKAIIMETNVKFPPHIRFAMAPGYVESIDGSGSHSQIPFDSEKRGHIYGCSLGYQVHDTMRPAGYEIHYMDWNNVMYVDTLGMSPALKAFEDLYTDVNEWYNYGYWNRVNREITFRFNQEINYWNLMETDALMEELQRKIMPMHSHANHHISWNGAHYCFDSEGNLSLASSENAKCSKVK